MKKTYVKKSETVNNMLIYYCKSNSMKPIFYFYEDMPLYLFNRLFDIELTYKQRCRYIDSVIKKWDEL